MKKLVVFEKDEMLRSPTRIAVRSVVYEAWLDRAGHTGVIRSNSKYLVLSHIWCRRQVGAIGLDVSSRYEEQALACFHRAAPS